MASDREAIRSKEHVRHKFSICSADHQHTGKGQSKDVEQFDDFLMTSITDTNKFEHRFDTIRKEEKMLAVKKLMLESLLNYRFRGTTMSYSELLVAVENNIVDKVATVPTVKSRRADTSALTEIGMPAKYDGESAREEGDQRIVDLALQAVHSGTGGVKWNLGKGQKGVPWGQRRQRWRKEPVAKGQLQERQHGARERRKGRRQNMLDVWKSRTHSNKILYAIDEEDSEHVEEANDSEEDLQA